MTTVQQQHPLVEYLGLVFQACLSAVPAQADADR